MHLTYEHDYKSREDGRYPNMLGAYRAFILENEPKLAFNDSITKENYHKWQSDVKDKMRELLCMPEKTVMQTPIRIGTVQRDGYRVEKWEFYPGSFSAVSFLLLIPDCATKEHPAPAAICLPGSRTSKEILAGEAVPPHPNYQQKPYPERNCQARHLAKAGFVAAAFDNPCTCENSCMTPVSENHTVDLQRYTICHSLIQYGLSYPGISAYEKLCFLDWFKELPFVDSARLAAVAHSLGTDAALPLAVICDDIKAYVHNDFVCDERRRFIANTDVQPEDEGFFYRGLFHIVPGSWQYFAYQDLLAALVPKYLAMNEGGAEEFTNKILRAYAMMGVPSHAQLTHYPKFAAPESRTFHDNMPTHGLTD
ncbi:MAG: hypothetical protein J5746_02370, partial [Victivallales bacterium]|nr:hypothetical protein [Victivallales bacterium]